MSLFKLAETIELSINIPDSEKKIAAKIVFRLEKLNKKIDFFNKHLNKLYNPLKKYNKVSKDSVEKYRGIIWNYTKQIKENFEKIRNLAILCLQDLKRFETDPEFNQLISSFTNDFGDVEDQVIYLTNAIINWDASNYKENVILSMDNLKKETAEIRKLIYDRLISHINKNILTKNWIDNGLNRLNVDMENNEPAISRLYKERKDKLKRFF